MLRNRRMLCPTSFGLKTCQTKNRRRRITDSGIDVSREDDNDIRYGEKYSKILVAMHAPITYGNRKVPNPL